MQERPVPSHHHHQLSDWGPREFKEDGCEDGLGPSAELKGTRPQSRVGGEEAQTGVERKGPGLEEGMG